ncbi:MAG: hypothetical protein U5R49_14555 [Deltaproteobacteria bacterium]|nr:hypothetical protein [Deltaproteobacteria bacterium]
MKEELDRSFGWGKAPDNMDVEVVDVKKGVHIDEYGDYKFPTPAVSLSIKNLGNENLESFSVTCGFSDIDHKRDLGHCGTASGSIKAG